MATIRNVNVTLSVPLHLKHEMDSLKEINWSEVMRALLAEKVRRLHLLKKLDVLTAGSTLTENDVALISDRIKKGVAKRHGLN